MRFWMIVVWLIGAAFPAHAQVWPPREVRVIVPFGPGSTPDIVARVLSEELQQMHPASAFIVENKAGASGNLGTDAVAKAAPDGSVIGISIGGPLAINALLNAKLPYDPKTDITPITQLVTQPSALAVNPSLNVNSVAELLALLKQNPGKYNFGSIGNGSLSHLAMEAVALKGGAQMVHIAYPSSPAAMTALIRGDIQIACLPAISVKPHADAGSVKLLAISTAARSPYLPGVPTLAENGIDIDADAWNGLIGPRGMSAPLITAINRDVVAVLAKPAMREKLAAQIMGAVGGTPEQFRALIERESARWAPVIDVAKIKVN